MTSRFNDQCLDYLPVDLNSCLYKYEKDLERAALILGQKRKTVLYSQRAKKRKLQMNKLMWNQQKSFFFDYNFNRKKRSDFYSIAGFYPLWAGLATKKQAKAIRKKNLPLFEQPGGIVNTLNKALSKEFKQHDYPNGWPQQQYIVIKGLLNYGFNNDAQRN
jgi:alpha,alpha-trehalase